MRDTNFSLEWAGILSCNNPHSKLVVDCFRILDYKSNTPSSGNPLAQRATLNTKEPQIFQHNLQILNIQYKIPEDNMIDQAPDHLFLIVPSNPTHQKIFQQYEHSFTEHKMIGMVSAKSNFIFLISPRNNKVLKYYPQMQKGHLLGIYFVQNAEEEGDQKGIFNKKKGPVGKSSCSMIAKTSKIKEIPNCQHLTKKKVISNLCKIFPKIILIRKVL